MELNRCTGLTSGCSATTRWIGATFRHSARVTGSAAGSGAGAGGGLASFLRNHIVRHRPWLIRVLIRAISAT